MTDFCKHGYSVQLQNQTFFFAFRIEERKVCPETILTLFYSALRNNLEKIFLHFQRLQRFEQTDSEQDQQIHHY